MARAIWSGAISFGLVTVPVKLYTATSSHRVSFHQFQEGTGERVRYQRVAESNGEEVEYDDIVKGAEVEKGRYVIVTPDELEAVQPGKSRTIEIEDFVDLADIDPIAWNRTYYLGPDGEQAARPYRLLLDAMRDTGHVAIARFVMRDKQYLATIRPLEDVLALETMFFADEIRSLAGIDGVPVEADVDDRQLGIAEQLITSMATKWDPTNYRDTYHERVLELIERKAQGEDVVVEPEQEETAAVSDLMDALQRSVEAARTRREERGDRGAKTSADGEEAEDLEKLSKDDLYERATQADVSGRSKMTKDELIAALTRKRAS
jgi:DNA end-binding protein Ku